MIESMYLIFIFLAFLFLIIGILLKSIDYLPAQVTFLLISLILFVALAISSAQVEVVHCGYKDILKDTTGAFTTYNTTQQCVTDNYYYEENMYIFGFLALVVGVLSFIVVLKCMDPKRR